MQPMSFLLEFKLVCRAGEQMLFLKIWNKLYVPQFNTTTLDNNSTQNNVVASCNKLALIQLLYSLSQVIQNLKNDSHASLIIPNLQISYANRRDVKSVVHSQFILCCMLYWKFEALCPLLSPSKILLVFDTFTVTPLQDSIQCEGAP